MSGAASLLIAPIGRTGRSSTIGTPGNGQPVVGDESSLLEEIRAAADSGADLILLPQLSFSPYFPADRDREALELGERFPSAGILAARDTAGGAWLAASAYECVGEGVFYVRGELGTAGDGCLLAERQRRVEAEPGRFEQMYFSPGHGPRRVAETPWGTTGILLGADARDPDAWKELAGIGTALVVASVSEEEEGWQRATCIASGLSAVFGIPLAMVNRDPAPDEPGFAGGAIVTDPAGNSLAADEAGLFALEIPEKEMVETV